MSEVSSQPAKGPAVLPQKPLVAGSSLESLGSKRVTPTGGFLRRLGGCGQPPHRREA